MKDADQRLDDQYQQLREAKPSELDTLLSALDPRNALELDIARQFLAGLNDKTLREQPHLKMLGDIIASEAKYPRAKLKELIEPRYERVKKDDYDGSLPIVEKVSFADGKIHFREDRETGMDLYRASKGDLVTSKINIHQGAVAVAACDLVASTHYQMYQVHTQDVHPVYLVAVLRSSQFLALLNEQKSKGIKNEQGAEFFGEFEIPLPPMEVQEHLVEEIVRQKAISDGATLILENHRRDLSVFDGFHGRRLHELVEDLQNGLYKSGECYGGGTPIVRINDFANGELLSDVISLQRVTLTETEIRKYALKEDDILVSS